MREIADEMSIGALRARLRQAHRRMGGEGRIALTLNQEPGEGAYVTHWVKPDGSAFEDCRAVGAGSLRECLSALDGYAAAYRRRPTVEEIGRTLGLEREEEAGGFRMAAE
ncbi:MAG TPA: hypothetical protein VEB20_18225 [Azospirillaceae bacterium]|nr:hypothetical protein [Azospirillaceae bacterium]